MFQNCTNQTKGLSYIIKVRRRRMVNKWEISSVKMCFGNLLWEYAIQITQVDLNIWVLFRSPACIG